MTEEGINFTIKKNINDLRFWAPQTSWILFFFWKKRTFSTQIIDLNFTYEEASKKKVVRVVFFVQSGLGLARVPESLWKPHKSKEHKILHRSCAPTFFQLPKKIFFEVEVLKDQDFKNPLGIWKFSFVNYKGKFFKSLKDFPNP